jgi:hypothetical protein|nr:MAG TPA_asm: hypothetical protein [Caudoviricetes sp.]
MRPLSYLKKRKLELQKAIELLNQDLQGAEHDLREHPCKETWEAVEKLEKKYALLDSEASGVDDAISNYDMYCYFEEQEELMLDYMQAQVY